MPTTLTVREVANLLQLKQATVCDQLKSGRIPGGMKLGNVWRIDKESFDAWYQAKLHPVVDPHGFSPRSSRSAAATRGRQTINRNR